MSADLQKLKDYLAKRRAGDNLATQPIAAADLAPDQQPPANETATQRRAREKAERAVDQAEQDAKKEQQRAAKEAAKNAPPPSEVTQLGKPTFAGWSKAIGRLPTPGDVAFPLTILLVFLFLIVPIGGKTRALWFFEVLIGRARVKRGQGVGGGQKTGSGTTGNVPLLPQSTSSSDNSALVSTLSLNGSYGDQP